MERGPSWLVQHLVDTGKIDPVDAKILQNLIYNSREAIRAIAEDANVSRPTVYERIRRLEEIGIIDFYTTQINYNQSGLPLTAFIQVAFNPIEAKDQKIVAQQISELNYVKRVHIITGEFDFLVEIAIDHMTHLADVIIDQIRAINGVGNTISNVSFKAYQNGVEINVPYT